MLRERLREEECHSGFWENLAGAVQSFRPQVSGSRVLMLSEALASFTLSLQVPTNLLSFRNLLVLKHQSFEKFKQSPSLTALKLIVTGMK